MSQQTYQVRVPNIRFRLFPSNDALLFFSFSIQKIIKVDVPTFNTSSALPRMELFFTMSNKDYLRLG